MVGTSGKRVLSEHQVRVSAAPVRVGQDIAPVTAVQSAGNSAEVNEVRDQNGNLQELHVTCGCGKTIVIECDYS